MASDRNTAGRLTGILLSAARHVINVATLLAMLAYLFFAVAWMHAPLFDVLRVAEPFALWPLALAWLCGRIGRRLREDTPVFPPSPVARILLACAGVFMVSTAATTALAAFRQYECSSDPARTATARDLHLRTKGFERVCTGDLARFDISFGSIERATRKLAFPPVDLAHTPFSTLEALGGKVELVDDVPSRLYRGFRTADGHRLTLSEHDMSADGSRAWRDPKDEPERIKGMPARLVVLEDASGAAISQLSWFEGRRAYELWIDANVVTRPLRERLFALAASLPPSRPGCPNEVPPKPLRFDADGAPVDEPLPAMMTQAGMDARFDKDKRPCK